MSDWASATAQSVRHLVYQTFAQQGRAPSPAELAGELELDPANVLRALDELHERHALVLAPAGDAIRMAHPFSAAPMGFVVRAGDQFWWGRLRMGLVRDRCGPRSADGDHHLLRRLWSQARVRRRTRHATHAGRCRTHSAAGTRMVGRRRRHL